MFSSSINICTVCATKGCSIIVEEGGLFKPGYLEVASWPHESFLTKALGWEYPFLAIEEGKEKREKMAPLVAYHKYHVYERDGCTATMITKMGEILEPFKLTEEQIESIQQFLLARLENNRIVEVGYVSFPEDKVPELFSALEKGDEIFNALREGLGGFVYPSVGRIDRFFHTEIYRRVSKHLPIKTSSRSLYMIAYQLARTVTKYWKEREAFFPSKELFEDVLYSLLTYQEIKLIAVELGDNVRTFPSQDEKTRFRKMCVWLEGALDQNRRELSLTPKLYFWDNVYPKCSIDQLSGKVTFPSQETVRSLLKNFPCLVDTERKFLDELYGHSRPGEYGSFDDRLFTYSRNVVDGRNPRLDKHILAHLETVLQGLNFEERDKPKIREVISNLAI
jgi:hypothetical protein